MAWVKYNYGPAYLEFRHKNGSPFNGTIDEWEKEHFLPHGLRRIEDDKLIVVDYDGDIAAIGRVLKEE